MRRIRRLPATVLCGVQGAGGTTAVSGQGPSVAVIVNDLSEVDTAGLLRERGVAHAGAALSRAIPDPGRFDLDLASALPGRACELVGEHAPKPRTFGNMTFVLRAHGPLHPWCCCAFMDLPLSGRMCATQPVRRANRLERAASDSHADTTTMHEPEGHCWRPVPGELWPLRGTSEGEVVEARRMEPYGTRVDEVDFIGRSKGRVDIKRARNGAYLNHARNVQGSDGRERVARSVSVAATPASAGRGVFPHVNPTTRTPWRDGIEAQRPCLSTPDALRSRVRASHLTYRH